MCQEKIDFQSAAELIFITNDTARFLYVKTDFVFLIVISVYICYNQLSKQEFVGEKNEC